MSFACPLRRVGLLAPCPANVEPASPLRSVKRPSCGSVCGPIPREHPESGIRLRRRSAFSGSSPLFAAYRRYRGARIRTGDLTDPNGARYQAAPRPDAPSVFHTAIFGRCPPPRATSSMSSTASCSPRAFRTTARTACRFPAPTRSRLWPQGSRRSWSCSSWPRPSRPSCSSCTTASSGAPDPARSTRR